MKNIPIEELEQILQETLNDAPKVAEILKKIEVVAEELKAEKAETKLPKSKFQYSIIAFNVPEGVELTGLVVKLGENEDVNTILGKISNAARNQNESKKKKKNLITTIGEAAQGVKRKWLKAENINILTKHTIQIIKSDNKLV